MAWAALFGVVYLLVYRAAAQNSYLQTYWNRYFLNPLAPGFGRDEPWKAEFGSMVVAFTLE